MRGVVIAGLLLLGVAQARAEPSVVAGAGGTTCGQFASAYKGDVEFVEEHYYAWAQGFMSGVNIELMWSKRDKRDLNALTLKEQMMFIRTYCDAHPLLVYAAAVIALYSGLPVVPYKGD